MRKKTILGNYRDPWTSEKEQGWHIVVLAWAIFTTAPTTAQASVPRRVDRPICPHYHTVKIVFLSFIARFTPPITNLLKQKIQFWKKNLSSPKGLSKLGGPIVTIEKSQIKRRF